MSRKRWPKRLLIAVCVVAVVTTGGGVVGKYWIIPAVIRSQIAAQLAGRWDGRADIQRVEVDWNGAIRLAGLDLYDASGRQWAHAGAVELGLRSLISTTLVLESVAARDLTVQWHYGPGLRPPFKDSPPGGGAGGAGDEAGGGWEVDLQGLRVDGCSLVLVDPNGRRQGWDFEISGAPSRDGLAVALRQRGQSPGGIFGAGSLAADGIIDTRANRCSLKVALSHRFTGDEVAAIVAASGRREEVQRAMGPEGLAAGGCVDANVTIDLPLAEPGAFQILGAADLSGWQVRRADGLLTQDARARVTFRRDRRLDIDWSDDRAPLKRLSPMLNLPLTSLISNLAILFR